MKEEDHLEDPDVDRRIIFKWISGKWDVSNQPTKGLTRGGDLREAQVDVPSSV